MRQDAGYLKFLMIGKWHLGADRKDCWSLQRGFEHSCGCLSGAITYFEPGGDWGITEGNDPVATPDGWYATDALTHRAIDDINEAHESADRPFFLYLAYDAPHWPLNAKWGDYQKYRDRYRAGGMFSCGGSRQSRSKSGCSLTGRNRPRFLGRTGTRSATSSVRVWRR